MGKKQWKITPSSKPAQRDKNRWVASGRVGRFYKKYMIYRKNNICFCLAAWLGLKTIRPPSAASQRERREERGERREGRDIQAFTKKIPEKIDIIYI